MAYRLEPLRANQWAILDTGEESVFTGTLAECEQWLDAQDPSMVKTSACVVDHVHRWLKGEKIPGDAVAGL